MKEQEIDNVSPEFITKLFSSVQKASLWQVFNGKRAATNNKAAVESHDKLGDETKGKRGNVVAAKKQGHEHSDV